MNGKLIILVTHLFVLGALLTALTHFRHRSDRRQCRQDWLKYVVYLLLVTLILAIAHTGRELTSVLLLLIALLGALEVYRCAEFSPGVRLCLSALAMLLLATCLLQPLIPRQPEWTASFSFLFLIVCVTDSFSQLWGRLLGRHRFSKLSPNKTCEGLVGGATTAIGCAAALSFLLPHLQLTRVLALGLAVVVAAIAGDLLFSLVKRRLGVKDFSALVPGHGGILDRFDSLVLATPAFYWFHEVLK
jgi:phosphatidate cytidylyltransferase